MSGQLHALAVILLGEDPFWYPQDREFCGDANCSPSPATNRRNYSRFRSASGSRWRRTTDSLRVGLHKSLKGHQNNTSDGDAAQIHCLVFSRKTGRPGSRCGDNIKRNLKETAWGDGGLNSYGSV